MMSDVQLFLVARPFFLFMAPLLKLAVDAGYNHQMLAVKPERPESYYEFIKIAEPLDEITKDTTSQEQWRLQPIKRHLDTRRRESREF